jgi:hypothetical protein
MLKVSMFHKSNDFPRLKGKAAEIRHVLGGMLKVCREYLDGANATHRKIMLMLKLAIEMEDILDKNVKEYRIALGDAARFKNAADGFVALEADLRQEFQELAMPNGNPILLWHFTIKFHYMLHIGNMAAFCNPRNAWCYAGESLMQRVRILVQSSCRGLPAHKLGEKCLKKYCLALGMTLSKEP